MEEMFQAGGSQSVYHRILVLQTVLEEKDSLGQVSLGNAKTIGPSWCLSLESPAVQKPAYLGLI